MGAFKNFCIEVAEAGRCLVNRETLDYLDDIECSKKIDWIGYCCHQHTGQLGLLVSAECITIESARRLVAEGLANDEISDFVEFFGDCAPECRSRCSDCGAAVNAGFCRVSRHGERFCPNCS